jgi:hypothetical protein
MRSGLSETSPGCRGPCDSSAALGMTGLDGGLSEARPDGGGPCDSSAALGMTELAGGPHPSAVRATRVGVF